MNIAMIIPRATTNDLTSKDGFVSWSELNIASSSDFMRHLLKSASSLTHIDWAHNEQSGFDWL
jgi:hypothetical protein